MKEKKEEANRSGSARVMVSHNTKNENEAQKSVMTQNIRGQFESASKELNAKSYSEIESLKFRSMPSYHSYIDLLTQFRSEMKVVKASGTYHGTAWKVTNRNGCSILIVEHETGLEILYVTGAVASVLEIIWKAASLWNRSRPRQFPNPDFGPSGMERRRFDEKGQMIEEVVPSLDAVLLTHLMEMYTDLSIRVSKVEEYLIRSLKLEKEEKEKKRE